MTPLIPGLEAHLVAEANVLATHRLHGRRRRRFRFGGTTFLSAFVLTSGAYAARDLWLPVLGSERRGYATPSETAVPADQLAAFGVLRRPATDADRGPAAKRALRFAGADTLNLRPSAVRVLGFARTGDALVLVPVGRQGHSESPASEGRDPLCLWLQTSAIAPNAGTFRCGSLDQVRAGRLVVNYGMRGAPGVVAGLVPDGVKRVSVGAGAGRVVVPVRNNAYIAEQARYTPLAEVRWINTDDAAPR